MFAVYRRDILEDGTQFGGYGDTGEIRRGFRVLQRILDRLHVAVEEQVVRDHRITVVGDGLYPALLVFGRERGQHGDVDLGHGGCAPASTVVTAPVPCGEVEEVMKVDPKAAVKFEQGRGR